MRILIILSVLFGSFTFSQVSSAETLTTSELSVWTAAGHYDSNITQVEILPPNRDARFHIRVYVKFQPQGHAPAHMQYVGDFFPTIGILEQVGDSIYWRGNGGQRTEVAHASRGTYRWPANPGVVRVQVIRPARSTGFQIAVTFSRP